MTDDAALAILRERSGRMYDPQVVAKFIEIYRDVVVTSDAPEQRHVLARITRSRQARVAAPAPSAAPAAAPASAAASNDVLAFVSIARLAAGEAALSDVLSLASNLVSHIVPSATGGWYVPDARGVVVAVDAFGPFAEMIRGSVVQVGERLTGWVAANRQAIVNSDAALDLDERVLNVAPQLQSCLSVPLMAGDALSAVLTLYAPERDVFTDDLGRLIQMIGPHVSRAIALASSGRRRRGFRPRRSSRARRSSASAKALASDSTLERTLLLGAVRAANVHGALAVLARHADAPRIAAHLAVLHEAFRGRRARRRSPPPRRSTGTSPGTHRQTSSPISVIVKPRCGVSVRRNSWSNPSARVGALESLGDGEDRDVGTRADPVRAALRATASRVVTSRK